MEYKLYYLDPFSGHIAGFDKIQAEQDDAAIGDAAAIEWDGAVELWHGSRKVARFDPDGEPTGA